MDPQSRLGKTITRRLTSEELQAWQPLFDNARKIRELVAELHEHTLQAIQASPPQSQTRA